MTGDTLKEILQMNWQIPDRSSDVHWKSVTGDQANDPKSCV